MFTMAHCPWCTKAEEFLVKKKLKCHSVDLQENQFLAFEVMKATSQRTVPNIFIDGAHVGGHDSLLQKFDQCVKDKKNEEVYCNYFRGNRRQ
jgi:glutaredoxin 3